MPPRVEALDAAALIARLQEHSQEPDVQADCCLTLCKNSDQLSAEAALTFLPAVISVLRAHPGHARLQKNGCAVLGYICRGRSADALASAAGAADGVRAVVAALRAHPADAYLQSSCCGVLDTLSRHAWLREVAVDAGAVQAVVAALQAHVQYEAGMGVFCNALGQIVQHRPLGLVQAGAAGAVAATVAAMRTHPASPEVQAGGCFAFGWLTFSAENQMKAIQAGAIEAILQAQRGHAADVRVQAYGCKAVGNVAKNRSAAIDARSSSLLLDAAKAAVAALNAHHADAGVARHACMVVHHLIDTDTQQVEAGKSGALTAVIVALRAHPADALTQQYGCGATASLCFKNSVNSVQACGAGALQALVAGLRAHAANVKVQDAGCDALGCLVDAHPRLQAAAGAAGAVEATVDALRLPAADAGLQRTGCGALLALVRGHSGNAAHACAAGVIEALAALMSSRYAHEENAATPYSVYVCAVSALVSLLERDDNGDTARRTVQAGVPDIMAREETQHDYVSGHPRHVLLMSMLEAAAQRHDAAVCTHDGCKRCAAARDAGRMCALPGCGARKRDGDNDKKLLRCGSCRAACYCAPAHQRADWGRHKDECAALRAASEAAEQQPDE
jgi:hypothetical protein